MQSAIQEGEYLCRGNGCGSFVSPVIWRHRSPLYRPGGVDQSTDAIDGEVRKKETEGREQKTEDGGRKESG